MIVLGTLVVFGFFVLFFASYNIGVARFGDSTYYLRQQILKGGLAGLVGFFLLSRIRLEILKKYSLMILIVALGLSVLVFFPRFNFSHNGSSRWISFGFVNFQPAEILKLSFLVYLASWLQSRRREIKGFSAGLLPFAVIIGIIGFLLLAQPDLGTFGIIALSAIAVYFTAGGKLNHLALLGIVGIAAFSVFVFFKPYAAERIKVFLHPQNDASGSAYQINQALAAIGIGGVSGAGIGRDFITPYLPEAIGDSIFAVLGEKLGLFGISFALALYLLFAVFGYRIAMKSGDYFSELLAVGITTWIVVQSFFNIAAISGIVPLTGVPLPFMSYGGSSLAINLSAAGIIANISRSAV